MLNGEKLKAFPRRSGRKYGCPYLPNLFNIILEVSDRAMRQYKEIKKGMNSKVTLFVGDTLLYMADAKESIRKKIANSQN